MDYKYPITYFIAKSANRNHSFNNKLPNLVFDLNITVEARKPVNFDEFQPQPKCMVAGNQITITNIKIPSYR